MTIVSALALNSLNLSGQTDAPRTAQEAIEAQEAAKQERAAAAEKARAEGREQHWKNQDRATRRRMRRSYRQSHRIALGRTTPWWQRVLNGARR